MVRMRPSAHANYMVGFVSAAQPRGFENRGASPEQWERAFQVAWTRVAAAGGRPRTFTYDFVTDNRLRRTRKASRHPEGVLRGLAGKFLLHSASPRHGGTRSGRSGKPYPDNGMVPDWFQAEDATTIRLFREALAEAGLIDKLFERFGQHFEATAYIARGGQIIDATIVSAPKQATRRRRTR